MRLTIAGMMVAVLLAAVDAASVRSPLSGRSVTEAVLLMGALPMVNLLVLALLPLLHGRGGRFRARPALVGFEVAGVSIILLFAAGANRYPLPLLEGVAGAISTLQVPGGPSPLSAVIALSVPQLAFALAGGWLGRKVGRSSSPQRPSLAT